MHERRTHHVALRGAGIIVVALLLWMGSVCPAGAIEVATPMLQPRPGLGTAFAPRAVNPLLPSLRLDAALQPESPATQPSAPGVSKSGYALPMLLSAVVPGAGEISMGHWWRGLPLVAIDVATWLGYAHYQSDGNDKIDAYEAYVDQWWSETQWQDSLSVLEGGKYYDENADWNCGCSPPYIPKDEDAREWYENAGKYPQFFSGWEGWHRNYDPEDPTSRRRIYADMRIDANETLDNADRLIGVAALTRVVSIVQSFWLVRRDSRSQSLVLEPVTFRGLGSGLRLKAVF